MSIQLLISSLSDPLRLDILQSLTFRLTNDRSNTSIQISTYHIPSESSPSSSEDVILIPFAWAVSHNFPPPPRSSFSSTSLTFHGELRPTQKAYIPSIIASLNTTSSVILSLHVGFGKSIISSYIISKLNLPTLIIVNRLVLATQWVETCERCFPENSTQLITAKTTSFTSDIYIVNFINVPKLPKEFLATIGVLLMDEIHLLCSKTLFKGFFSLTPRYIIGMSATPYRSDDLNKLIPLYFGDTFISCELKRIHDVHVIYTGIKLDYKLAFDGKIDWNSVLNSQANHNGRNRLIISLLQKHPDRNFLVLVKRIAHGERLKQLLEEKGESVADLLGSKTTFDKSKRILIASASKVGTGFSHDSLDALILSTDIEAYIIQFIGRVFRTETGSPIIYDLVDDAPALAKHFKTRKKVYEGIGAKFTVRKEVVEESEDEEKDEKENDEQEKIRRRFYGKSGKSGKSGKK